MKLAIIIPVYLSDPLHVEFTQETIESIRTRHDHHIYLIENYAEDRFRSFLDTLDRQENLTVLKNPAGNSLSAAWNLGLKKNLEPKTANLKADYALIINNDIVFHPEAIDNLVTFAQDHPEFSLVSGTVHENRRTLNQATWDGSFAYHPHFSCFMLSSKTTELIGYFDENLDTAYFEDNDYHIRILLAGHQAAATTTAPFYHYGSRTAQVDDDLRLKLKPFYRKNRRYLQDKWGIDLHGKAFSPPEKILEEIYPTPFNDPEMTIKDW